MRAGRLISLMLILERRGRVTAARLAAELEVSERTVLRDIDELTAAGVPIVATRGPGGGFALGDGAAPPVSGAPGWEPGRHGSRRRRRAIVRITPEGVRLAAMLRRLQPLKVRRKNGVDGAARLEAAFWFSSIDAAAMDVLSLGPCIEVAAPVRLRDAVAARALETASLYTDRGAGD
jgi:predicted DNA-binding transcriptional regulator YafY